MTDAFGLFAPVLPLAWATAVVVTGWQRRPRPTRRPPGVDLSPSGAPAGGSGPGRWTVGTALAGLGGALRRRTGRPADPGADLRLGVAVVASAVLVVAGAWPLAAGVVAAGPVTGRLRHRRRERRAADAVIDELPEVVDLFVLAAGAGLTVPLAVPAVARRATGPIGAGLAAADQAARLGRALPDALADLAASLGEPVRGLVAVLVSAERYGTPLVDSLARLAADVRVQRRRRAEAAARRVPVKLLFPLVLCTLPAFALLTVVPLLLSALGSLRL